MCKDNYSIYVHVLCTCSVGLLYDEFMAQHRCLWDDGFPERPERLTFPWKRCQELGLVERCKRIPVSIPLFHK